MGGYEYPFPSQKYRAYPFFLGIFKVNFKDILTKKGPETIDF